jgi:hypothetical protein
MHQEDQAEIEILRDPIEEFLESGLLMDERHEVLPDGEWIRAVRRRTGREDLFVYRHREVGSFVLAQWMSKDPRICLELESMQKAPDRGGWIDLDYMERRCEPIDKTWEAIQRKMEHSAWARREARRETAEARSDAMQWARRRGQEDLAAAVATQPYVGQTEGGERLAELQDDLRRMCRQVTYA